MSDLSHLLDRLNPSELALRDWVVPRLDKSMIDDIAAADYGMDVPANREAIEELRYFHRLTEELAWPPREVLELTRWSRVDKSILDPAEARRLHIMRLFSCLFLVCAREGGSPLDSLAPLVESAVELGPEAIGPTGSFLAWCRLHEPNGWRDNVESRPFLTLAVVVASVLLPAGRTPDLLPGLIGAFAEELYVALEEEGLLWTPRPVYSLLKRIGMASTRWIWSALADRCFVAGPAEDTGHGAQLARLGQAVRGEIAADAEELRSLLTDPR